MVTTPSHSTATKALYWTTILSACTMGETAGDFVSFGLRFGYGWAASALGALLVMVLVAEARAKTPSDARYWTTIVVMSTTGTALADLLTRTLKLGYGGGSALLTALFGVIYVAERLTKSTRVFAKAIGADHVVLPHVVVPMQTRSVPQTDAFYWAVILVASTFGTTMGDFVSSILKLGFGGASFLLGSLLAVVLTVEFRAKTPNKSRYWTALVIASTIGATTGDFLTKEDGLNLGYGWGSLILIAAFAIIFLARYLLGFFAFPA